MGLHLDDEHRTPWPQRSDVIERDGESKTLGEWAAIAGMSWHEFAHRLHLHRLDILAVLPLPDQPEPTKLPTTRSPRHAVSHTRRDYGRTLAFKGECLTITEWAERVGLRRTTITDRLRNGWSVERVLSPVRRAVARAECDHDATEAPAGGGSRLSGDIGDRRTVLRSIDIENEVFA